MPLKPNTQYTWDENSSIPVPARSFGSLINTLNAITGSKDGNGNDLYPQLVESATKQILEGNIILAIGQLHSIMNDVLSSAVDAGIATEVVPPGNGQLVEPVDSHIMD